MKIHHLDHVNLRTPNMEDLASWYCNILEMDRGYRPPFGVPGIWLYAGDTAMIHLLQVDSEPMTRDPRIEHFAMQATGLKPFLEKLRTEGISFRTARVPETRTFQVYLSDPESNHMHIDFPPQEADALKLP